MKFLYPLILIKLLANIALSAQSPKYIYPLEDAQNPFSYMVQPPHSSAKTLEEENLLIAYKRALKDGDSWREMDSIEYTYDDNDQLVSEERKVLSSTNIYQSDQRTIYQYDSEGNETYNEVQTFEEGSWVGWARIFKTYDFNNNLILEDEERYFEDEWVISFRKTYEYDSSNNLILYLNQDQSYKGYLTNNRKTSCEYDSKGNLILKLREHWREEEWKGVEKTFYEYDANNNQVQYISQYKYPFFSNWLDHYKFVNVYDANNNLILNIEYSWYGDHWGNNIRTEYEYDENGNLISENFDNEIFHQYAYDLQNNLTNTIRFHRIDNNWVPIYKRTSEYDIENNILEVIFQRWGDDLWYDNQRLTYYYIEENEALKPKLTLSFFPNPSTGEFIIDLEEHGIINGLLEIFNSKGQLVRFQKIDFAIYQLNVNLEGLSNGTYYLELSDENTQIKQTLMLVR